MDTSAFDSLADEPSKKIKAGSKGQSTKKGTIKEAKPVKQPLNTKPLPEQKRTVKLKFAQVLPLLPQITGIGP